MPDSAFSTVSVREAPLRRPQPLYTVYNPQKPPLFGWECREGAGGRDKVVGGRRTTIGPSKLLSE
jgi:hypothetical protein